jgi:ribosomal protein L40E
MWAASGREVLAERPAQGVQSCVNCGLALSATARFCRRCGNRQATA